MENDGIRYLTELWDSLVNASENKKKKNSAIDEIEDFINSYGDSKVPSKPKLPDAPEYERLTYDAPSDESIREQAESELSSFKSQGEKGIDKEIQTLKEKYDSDLMSAKDSYDSAAKSAETSYEAAKRNVDNDMLKRGLARSSIAANKQAELESGAAAKKTNMANAYFKQVDELNSKISALESQRQEALNDFNLSYATRLTELVRQLTDERDKKATEALKYNNTLTEKEHAAQVDKQLKESDLYSEALSQREKENALGQATEKDYLEVYTEIASKLRTLNKNDAREIVLNNPNVRVSVGNTYYYKLYDEFCR